MADDRTYRALIGGELVTAGDGAELDVVNPATEEIIARVPACGAADVEHAVTAAKAAVRSWRELGWAGRSRKLFELADLIDGYQDEFALLDAEDSGNPFKAMRGDAKNAVDHLRYFAGLAPELKGETLEPGSSSINYSVREPFGVVARIIPFNHPYQFAASKIAAPLAAGNPVIVKPSEHTSLSALRFAELVQDVLPPGVLNIVPGDGAGAGAALVRHPDVPRIAFTGSVPTGKAIMRDSAEYLKTISLELGGKNPMIVFPDVDIARAAAAAAASMNFSRSQGQSCGSTSRVMVHEDVYDAFLDAVVDVVRAIRVGDPMDESTDMGPLAFRGQYDKVTGYIASGIRDGARLLTGGGRPAGLDRGFYVEPTVFAEVDPSLAIAREEIFGPVMCVMPWTSLSDVLAAANDTDFGLTANIWTNDLALAHRSAAEISTGYVWINGVGQRPQGADFGGYHLSGLGKENSLAELLGYTRVKNVNVTFGPSALLA